MRITELDDSTSALTYPAMKELRPDLADAEELITRVKQQRSEGYRLLAVHDEADRVVSVAGFRRMHTLALGDHLYIDDLVTLPEARGRGHAAALLRWIDEEAKRLGCGGVHLDSGPHRHTAHRRYFGSGFHIVAYHFGKAV